MFGCNQGTRRGSMKYRTIPKTILEPFVIVAAALYFVIDALALSSLKPLLRKIANLKLFKFIARWIASLGPYPTLTLFVVPLVLLEPVKPFSAYVIASGGPVPLFLHGSFATLHPKTLLLLQYDCQLRSMPE